MTCEPFVLFYFLFDIFHYSFPFKDDVVNEPESKKPDVSTKNDNECLLRLTLEELFCSQATIILQCFNILKYSKKFFQKFGQKLMYKRCKEKKKIILTSKRFYVSLISIHHFR